MKEMTKSYAINRIAELEQENAELKKEAQLDGECIDKLIEEKNILHKIIDRLLENSGYSIDIASAEDFEDVYEDMQYKNNKFKEYKQTLNAIKEIAEDGTKTEDYLLGQRYTDLIDRIIDLITKAEVGE